jgi:hypothetical protein
MPAFIIERFGRKETIYGETAGKAKYQAWLDSESGYDFPDYLQTIDSCCKDQYASRMQLQRLKPDMMPRDTVIMHTCIEAKSYKDREWTVITEPQIMCGTWIVWLEGYSGCFACEYLKVIRKAA